MTNNMLCTKQKRVLFCTYFNRSFNLFEKWFDARIVYIFVEIQNLVNPQIGNSYQVIPPTPIATVQSPVSEDSSWTTSSVTGNQQPTAKEISSLVQQQPLLTKKPSEPTWDDDSRPLSADLKRTSFNSKSHISSSSDDSDDDQDKKSATIVKSPLTGGVLSNLVQTNIRSTEFTEIKPTGIENLTRIIDTIMHTSPPLPPPTTQKL